MIEHQFEDGVVAERVGVVGIFIACGNLKDALCEQVFWGKVDTTLIAWVRQYGRQSTGEAQLVIDIFDQDLTGIRRHASTIEVKLHRFGPDRRQRQWYRLQLGCHNSWHRINT